MVVSVVLVWRTKEWYKTRSSSNSGENLIVEKKGNFASLLLLLSLVYFVYNVFKINVHSAKTSNISTDNVTDNVTENELKTQKMIIKLR